MVDCEIKTWLPQEAFSCIASGWWWPIRHWN